jgi:5-methylcytosine-specific restriction enzyme A
MSLADLTRDAVLDAIAECDRLGRDAFLATYGFRAARQYILVHGGKEYDSKAVAGVAHGYLPKEVALTSNDFSGGEQAAAGKLRQLDFEVRGPDWKITQVPTYEPGAVYHRRRDIHARYHGQRQGGISTPKFAPLVFLFTGESGDQFGYKDGPQDDGTFAYTGEGQIGPMDFVRGNLAIRDHIADGKDLLLFEKMRRAGYYRFLGFFTCSSFEYATAPDRDGNQRQIIIFHLQPKISGGEPELEKAIEDLSDQPFERLRQLAIEDAKEKPAQCEGRRTYIQRSASVKAYVLRRAKGTCESCNRPAPFVRSNGEPYLEPHHTHRLADGGPDHPRWVGAVCPACHREIHHGKNGAEKNRALQKALATLEDELT